MGQCATQVLARQDESPARSAAQDAPDFSVGAVPSQAPLFLLNVPLVATDASGRILHANLAACTLTGYAMLQGRHVEELMAKSTGDLHSGYMRRYIETGQSRIIGGPGREVRLRRADGTFQSIILTIATTPTGFVAALVHMPNQKDEQWRSELQAQWTRFIAYLSHEVRVPMHGLRLGVGSLKDILKSPAQLAEAPGVLQDMEICVNTVMQLLNDVLDQEKMCSGEFAYGYSMTRLTALVHSATSIARIAVSSAGTKTLFTVLAPELRTHRVWCSGPRLIQLISNLLSNAVRHANVGGQIKTTVLWNPVVTVCDVQAQQQLQYRFNPPAGAHLAELTVRVWNSGSKLAPGSQDRLFAPFAFVGSSSKDGSVEGRADKAGRSGVGLSICKHIVCKGHMGTIDAWSDDTGTTFEARMPLFAVAAEPEPEVPLPDTELAPESPLAPEPFAAVTVPSWIVSTATPLPAPLPVAGPTGPTPDAADTLPLLVDIVTVDDSPMTQRMVHRVLQLQKWRVRQFDSGNAAVAWIKGGGRCKVVVTDRTMPGLSGMETTRQIKALDPRVVVVGITGDARETVLQEMRAAGASLVLVKPVDRQRLVQTAASAMALY
jgi:PAS domain S-box-containing protein